MTTLNLTSAGISVTELTNLEKIFIDSNPTLSSVSFSALLSVASLQITSNPVLGDVSFASLRAHAGGTSDEVAVGNNPALTSVSFPGLKTSTRAVSATNNAVLTSVQFNSLVFVRNYVSFVQNPLLVTLSLPSLVSVGLPMPTLSLGLLASGCTSLASVSLPAYFPVSGHTQKFDGCALTEASVDHILARCVASLGYVVGTVDLSGGTSAAPGTQGQLDKATLIARGVTVLTN